MKRLGYGATLVLAVAFAGIPNQASAQTFGGFPVTLTGSAGVSGSTLTLINDVYGGTGGAFTTTGLNLFANTPWTTSFNFGMAYTSYNPQADGFAFVVQSAGNNWIGLGGGNVGYYNNFPTSAAIAFRSWDNNDVCTGLDGFGSCIATHSDWGSAPNVTGAVSLSYDGLGNLLWALTTNLGDNLGGTTTFNESTLTGGNVFVGFVAGTGLSTSNTTIDNWQFTSGAASVTPEPATMTLLASGLVGMAGLRSRRRRKN